MLSSNTYAVFELARQRQAETTRRVRLGHVELATHGRRRRRRRRPER